MRNIGEQFLMLLQFMTRIPVFLKIEYSEEKLARGMRFFPMVGLIIGTILFWEGSFLLNIVENRQMVALLTIITEIIITGLIHIDGLADTFDGLFSYTTKEKILEIMKDSRIGTNGTVILILYFLCKMILLSEIMAIDMKYLIIYPVISRLSTSLNTAFGKYARDKGMSAEIIAMNTGNDGIFSFILTLITVFIIKGVKGILSLLLGLIFIFLFRWEVYRKIDGVTGDTMGASLELTAIIILIAGVILK